MIKFLRSKCPVLFVSGMVLLWSASSYAQTDESRVKALWVHTLISYIKWDSEHEKQDKTICTRGLDRTYHFLKEIQAEKKTSYNFIETGSNSDLNQCNLLYIAASERNNLSSILNNAESKNIVTVSDLKGFAEDGGIIELSHKDGTVKIKVNVKAAKKAKVIINSDLLAVSTIIDK
ncbi:MAG: hypothetical protein COV35_10345 [Alphaproteobacteria bacterium CG11_big_fil_rev_8_21_14_0_20_39_49]|nr:MAG: hypothetical protein COV35_10345 [Alphaproteobacteria bacterium CG11_big_fil_rev_8_21_14_0_20_39_49]